MCGITREAIHYKQMLLSRTQCTLCPHACILHKGEVSTCRSRANIDGKLMAINYALCAGIAIDNIEKKPLYHFRPGSKILSLGANSCNLACSYCQNFSISQSECKTKQLDISELYDLASKQSLLQVAFTYTEPITWYEYIVDFAQRYPDVSIVMISNGYINPQPLKELLPYIDAMNIDLKGIEDSFYGDHCSATLSPVLDSIATIYESDTHLEITNLLIPGLNTKAIEVDKLARFIASVSPDIPLHISAYHPDYLMDVSATSISDIEAAINIAKIHLHYVYGGNLPISDFSHTLCPQCGDRVIIREYGTVTNTLTDTSYCSSCGKKIYGIF